MKKELTIAVITLLLAATPVLAQSDHGNNGDDRGNSINEQTVHQNNSEKNENESSSITITPKINDADKDDDKTKPSTVPLTVTPQCDPSADWKNHGAFVSCAAHLNHHDDNDIDDAAKSDTGKQHQTVTPTPTVSVSPVPSETVTPTETPSPGISITPIASESPTPDISDMDTFKAPKNNFETLFGKFVTFLIHLL